MAEQKQQKKKQIIISDEQTRQIKRQLTITRQKQMLAKLSECPVLLTLNQLAEKSGYPYNWLRKLIVEERKIPFIKVGATYKINYNLFLEFVNGGIKNAE